MPFSDRKPAGGTRRVLWTRIRYPGKAGPSGLQEVIKRLAQCPCLEKRILVVYIIVPSCKIKREN